MFCACNRNLIAENALVGTAGVGEENGDNEGAGSGFWSLAAGLWSPVTGHWLLVTGHWVLIPAYWSLVSGFWPLVKAIENYKVRGG
jgi:hypothetical protein